MRPSPARRGPLRRVTVSPEAFRWITAAALVALAAIIVTGAGVRLSDSGMGCPTWPACEDGSLVPRGETGPHGWIEFGNRLVTGLVSVAVALAVLGSLRRDPRRDDLVRWSWGLVAGVAAQALLGGLVVYLHVAPVAVAGHYLLSAVLIWNAVVLHHKAGQPDDAAALRATGTGPPEPPGAAPHGAPARRAAATPSLVRLSRAVVALAAVVLVTGTLVTGSGPHGGDAAADRLPFAVVTVVRLHSVAVWLFLAGVLLVLWRALRGEAPPGAAARGWPVVGAIVAQGTIGYVQYFAGVPELLVGAHVLGSVLVWVAVLRFHLALASPAPVTVPAAPPAPLRRVAPVPS